VIKVYDAARRSGGRRRDHILALPTPPGADGSVGLKYVLGVANHLGKY
jgi:hypothetical protein